ncbi:PPOX class F420-dependent oxidoreductase [Actinocorallia aurea]
MGVNQRGQITMTDDEVTAFLSEQRIATLATLGPNGRPHLVAMWYAVLDGVLWFETKARSQKAVNLRRNGEVTVMVEAGHTYDQLRGVSLEGTAVVVDDPAALWDVGVDIWERYNGPYSEEVKPLVEVMLNKRVAVRLDVDRVRSWDHRKLGLPALELGGSTAAFL